MATAEQSPTPATIRAARAARPARTAHRYRRKLATLAAAAALVGGTAGVAAAAQGALPGDGLYPVKRGLENIQLQFTGGDAARGRDLLGQASTRMAEAHALLSSSTSARNVALASQALGSATDNANQGAALLFNAYENGHSASDVTAVRTFATEQMGALGDIAGLSDTVRPAASQLGDVLAAIDQQARSLCLTCSSSPALALPSSILDAAPGHWLAVLVKAPTQRATDLEELAAKAEAVAKTQQAQPVVRPTAQPTPGANPSTPTLTDVAPAPERIGGHHPVRQLLTGLSGSDEDVPGQVVNLVNGVVTGVGTTVSTLTGTAGGLLGQAPSPGASPTSPN